MALPALLAAGGSFLAQGLAGAGLTAGAVALMPSVEKMMGGGVKWKLNPDAGASDDQRVIQIDKDGNQTFRPLDNDTVKGLFGSWDGFRANAKERRERAQQRDALNKLEGRANRAEDRQMLQLQMQMQRMQADADLNRAQLELQGRQITQQGDIAAGQLNNDNARLNLEREKTTTLAEEARANRFDSRITQNNQIEASLHQNAVAEANRAYEFDVNNYNQREARRSVPGRTLMNIGAMLAGGRF